jgi:hypothetical protein
MSNLPFDIFKREDFGPRVWVEAAQTLEIAKRRVMELSASTPGKYMVVNRASGQMVGGGTTITSGGGRSEECPAEKRGAEAAKVRRAPRRKEDSDGETLWR